MRNSTFVSYLLLFVSYINTFILFNIKFEFILPLKKLTELTTKISQNIDVPLRKNSQMLTEKQKKNTNNFANCETFRLSPLLIAPSYEVSTDQIEFIV